MLKKKRKMITIVKHSCLTGKIVWVYRGRSSDGARIAYWRACRKEVRRVRQMMIREAERKKQLLRLLANDGSASSSFSIRADMSQEQRKAVREIVKLCKKQLSHGGEFYEHIIEEARRRNWQSNRWKSNREKLFRYGKTHTACDYIPKGNAHREKKKR